MHRHWRPQRDATLRWRIRCRRHVATVYAVGRIDVTTVTELRRALHLARRGARELVVDLRSVLDIDDEGIRVLLDEYDLDACAGVSLRVGGTSRRVREQLARAGAGIFLDAHRD